MIHHFWLNDFNLSYFKVKLEIALNGDIANHSFMYKRALRHTGRQKSFLVLVIKVIKFSPQLDFRGALFLATRGSAQVAGLDSVCGHFDVGMKLDALRISMTQQDCRLVLTWLQLYRRLLPPILLF